MVLSVRLRVVSAADTVVALSFDRIEAVAVRAIRSRQHPRGRTCFASPAMLHRDSPANGGCRAGTKFG
jgi:hypothetical protein